MEQQSLLPPKDPKRSYGLGGYNGEACDRAIRADNAPMLKECIDRGFIDSSSEMLDGKTILQFCIQGIERVKADETGKPAKVMSPRAPQCADMLMKMGWTIPPAKAEAFGIR